VLADTLNGSAGDDVLTGNLGADRLTGGEGADTFAGTLAHLDGDSITDLTPDDQIVLSGARLTSDAVAFADGKLAIDADGDGTADGWIALDGSFTGRFEATSSDPADAASTSIRYIAELPVISIKALDAEKPEGESGVTPFTFEVTRSGDLSGTSSVDYAVSGWGDNPTDWRDFDGPMIGTVTFVPGESSTILTVNAADDADSEFAEGFSVALSASTSATTGTTTAVGTITISPLLGKAGITGGDLQTMWQLVKCAYSPSTATLPDGWSLLRDSPIFSAPEFRSVTLNADGYFVGTDPLHLFPIYPDVNQSDFCQLLTGLAEISSWPRQEGRFINDPGLARPNLFASCQALLNSVDAYVSDKQPNQKFGLQDTVLAVCIPILLPSLQMPTA
jgi:hypothetical protein